jgi:aspartate ammonia-lyase
MASRVERDFLGEVTLPAGALFGVHSARASVNFPLAVAPVPVRLLKAFALVKKACAIANAELGYLPADVGRAIAAACDELASEAPAAQFPVDALQGGAGTSTNMNVNEVLANMALRRLGREPGDYACVHLLDSVNRHQSTNDTYPTAPEIGYDAATALAGRLRSSGRTDVRAFLEEAVGSEVVGRRLAPEAIMSLGYVERQK